MNNVNNITYTYISSQRRISFAEDEFEKPIEMKETRQEMEKSKALRLRKVRRGGKTCKNQEWEWIRSIDTITNTRWSDDSEAGRVITIRIRPKCLFDKIALQLSLLWVTRRYLCDYSINWEILSPLLAGSQFHLETFTNRS